ncbi:MAG: acyl carrier protein [Atopobiaceae bacterium]|jgi:acyl carrier protein|nr:acyl carrier protein [Atopobiaceae bacterium]MCI2173305.1 acyl carrier protein [Atopobiaceae bacterium]MCI2207300.1 acyl carrier protein [Atopobiaceae bacterium]
MDRASILSKVIEIIGDTVDIDGKEVTEQTSFDDLGADSLDRLELVTSFENEFDTSIDDAVLEQIKTVGDAVDAVEKAL